MIIITAPKDGYHPLRVGNCPPCPFLENSSLSPRAQPRPTNPVVFVLPGDDTTLSITTTTTFSAQTPQPSPLSTSTQTSVTSTYTPAGAGPRTPIATSGRVGHPRLSPAGSVQINGSDNMQSPARPAATSRRVQARAPPFTLTITIQSGLRLSSHSQQKIIKKVHHRAYQVPKVGIYTPPTTNPGLQYILPSPVTLLQILRPKECEQVFASLPCYFHTRAGIWP